MTDEYKEPDNARLTIFPNLSSVICHLSLRTSLGRVQLALWLAFLASLFLPLTGVAQKKPRIVFITHGQAGDPFWDVVRKGAETAAAETDSDLQYQSPVEFDLSAMSRMIDDATASRPDGLIVSIPDAEALGKSIQAAVAAKIPVISVNSGLGVSHQLGCLMHIGQEEESAGRMAGKRMKDIGANEVMVLNQEAGNVGLDQRVKGFKDGFEGPFHHVHVVRVRIDFWACYNTVVAYLQQHQEIDGILALGPVAATPALKAVIDVDELDKIKLCTFDISREVVEALSKKQMSFAVDQQQWLQGYLPIIFLANYAKHGALPQNDLILTGPSFVTPENVDRVASLIRKDSP
jgi:simple sugar transport system substrate-binding protein